MSSRYVSPSQTSRLNVPSAVMPAPTAGRQPEPCLELGGGIVRIVDGDDEVVDGQQHRRSVPGRSGPQAARYDGAVSQTLRLERSGPGDAVARVTLSRPEVHNAFDASLIGELRTTFALLARDGPTQLRAVVLAGDGPSFCAGADLAWMRAAMALDTEGNEQDAMAMADMFETIDTCPVPVIARVHGAALGGGMGLCAVADVVIAESGTRFGFTETRLGILPAVISPFVIAKIGETHARALFPGGRRFDATRAARIGLVHEIVRGRRSGRGDRRRRGGRPRVGADGGAGRQGDRPRGPRPRPRVVQVAHRPGHRPAAHDRGGAGGVPRLRRETPTGLGAPSPTRADDTLLTSICDIATPCPMS